MRGFSGEANDSEGSSALRAEEELEVVSKRAERVGGRGSEEVESCAGGADEEDEVEEEEEEEAEEEEEEDEEEEEQEEGDCKTAQGNEQPHLWWDDFIAKRTAPPKNRFNFGGCQKVKVGCQKVKVGCQKVKVACHKVKVGRAGDYPGLRFGA
jgi:hypothetical protein